MKDLKYILAYSVPLTALIALSLKGASSYLSLIYAFGFIPVLEMLLPEDPENYDDAEVSSRLKRRIFDWMLYLNIPITYGLVAYALFVITSTNLATYEYIGLILSVGIVLGTNGINVGHELGHRQSTSERFLGKLLLLPALYMHFYIEHNFGHHRHAATPEDPATARFKQSVYSFWFTSITRQYRNAWRIQHQLLSKHKTSYFSIKNDMFWYTIIQLGYLLLVFLLFSWTGLFFAIGAAVTGILLLESINYIEHYGLLRQKKDSGRYERVAAIHSWNSNHIIGRIMLYELTRHSDHHYKASKKYQVLQCYDESPQLPYGYPTSMGIALIPPLWFRIMNPRVPKAMILTTSAT